MRRQFLIRLQLHARLSDYGACSRPATAIRKRRFDTLQSVLAGQVEKARLDALGADISEFDFAGALRKLDDMVKEHGLNREEVNG